MGVIYKTSLILSRRLLLSNSCAILSPRYISNVPYLPRKTAQITYLKTAINNNEANWKTIRSDVLSKHGPMNEKNVDAVILKYITNKKMFNLAYSFANYLLKSDNELTLGVTNSLLYMYYEYAKTSQLSEEERMFILDSHKNLYNKYKVLDYTTCEKLLHALCAIDEWKKCIKILDDINLSTTPTHSAYSTLIATLFRNNKKAEAYKIIQRSLADKRPLQDQAYEEWIKYIFRKYKDKTIILKSLDEICLHVANSYITVSMVTADRIRESFTSLGWSAQYSTVKRERGQCSCCNHTLGCIKITNEEFASLQRNVKEKLIVGSDLFLKTSPDELKRFLDFVEKTAPYDVVLDGLNIAYASGKGNRDKVKCLSIVVDYFAKKNKRILLLGRKHMYKWHAPTIKQLSKKTCSFFTEDISQDDPYFITAAILSGAHTDIVSRDLLRGHRFLMKDEQLRLLFQRWQWKHQWMIIPARKGPFIQTPLMYTPCAQRTSEGWHIPLEQEQEIDEIGLTNNGIPDSSRWLCMKQNLVKNK